MRASVVSAEGAHDRISHDCGKGGDESPHQVDVTYEYRVGDRAHTSRTYDALTAFYDPDDSTRAVLALQSRAEAYGVLTAVGLVGIGVWGYFARQVVRYRRWRRGAEEA